MIDLRSDAVTQPTEAMWEAMRGARLGWAPAGEDANVAALEQRGVALSGKQAALLVPTGTVGNLLALLVHANRGEQLILEAQSHILWAEEGGYAYLAGLSVRSLPGQRGNLSAAEVEAAITQHSFNHRLRTGLVCLENTHNAAGGAVLDARQLRDVAEVAHRHGAFVHVDGARLVNAAVALDVEIASLCTGADSVVINLNKGLSAPLGALLCGTPDFVERCRPHLRRIGAGSMHQAGIYAAAGLVALDTMLPQLADDNRRARLLHDRLDALPSDRLVRHQVDTNVLLLTCAPAFMSARSLQQELARRGIGVSLSTDDTVRLVTHRHITDTDLETVIEVVRSLAA